jgi:hypothetical protein
MDFSQYYREILDYSVDADGFLSYAPNAAEVAQSASPEGMGAATVIALLGGGSYMSYRRSRDRLEDLKEEYLES